MNQAQLDAAFALRFTNTSPRSEDYRLGWVDGYARTGARPGAAPGSVHFDAYMSGYEDGRVRHRQALRNTLIDGGMVPA